MSKIAKRVREFVMRFNLFGETVNFEIRGQAAHKSFTGLVLSFGIFTTLLAYGTNKFFVFKDYQDTQHQQTIGKNYYKPDEKFSFDEFQVSIAVSARNEWILPEEYSKYMEITVQQYNKNKEGKIKEEIDTHSCRYDDLYGFNKGANNGLFNNSICIQDRSQMEFNGSSSRKTNNKLLIEIDRC